VAYEENRRIHDADSHVMEFLEAIGKNISLHDYLSQRQRSADRWSQRSCTKADFVQELVIKLQSPLGIPSAARQSFR
jgi:hypothetical protein